MVASSFPMPLLSSRPQNPSTNVSANPSLTHILRGRERGWINRRIGLIRTPPTSAIDGGTASNHATVEISWQIAVGALAGAMPFVVAEIAFGKRIVAQRRCGTCGGSGLVQRDEYYFRCPTCGGFLPWLSWKRFLTG
ncbi:uncharacterized protein LOC110028240 [Phalaenopsis equestris]|uniref:uncharacterized protein LOC110028240 n=1 Tax=Phalaenopsis equestris TaxID=78828 RepID=UPI0009E3643E|nr:uncharacterized protein LOC110028240 [Phalaenopsis equestris]